MKSPVAEAVIAVLVGSESGAKAGRVGSPGAVKIPLAGLRASLEAAETALAAAIEDSLVFEALGDATAVGRLRLLALQAKLLVARVQPDRA